MTTHKLKRKLKMYKLRTIYEVSEMSKQLLVASALSGMLLIMAPMASIAEPTAASVVAAAEVEAAPTIWEKAKAIVKGGATEGKNLWQSVTDVDERLIRKDEQLRLAQQQIIELKAEVNQVRFVGGLSLAETKACVITITEFLTTQVEGK